METVPAAARKIRISAGGIVGEATLDDSRTAASIWAALPIEAKADTWGDEIYFDVALTLPAEAPKAVVELGDLGYWPPGRAFCVFFGPTPSSRGDEIRPASPVNVFGRLAGDPTRFKKVRPGAAVRVERAEST